MSDEEFTLLPLVLPDDASLLARLHYHAFHLADPGSSLGPISEDEYIRTRTPLERDRLLGPGKLMAKMVLSDNHEKLVSYVVFSPPKPVDERTDEEREKEIRAIVAKQPGVKDLELIFRLKTEDRVIQEQFFGKGYESRFWELSALVTDENYQRRGLGSKLVEWGLTQVEDITKKSEGKVEGCYLIASLSGQRTYIKAGFEMVAERSGKEELHERHRHTYWIKKFTLDDIK